MQHILLTLPTMMNVSLVFLPHSSGRFQVFKLSRSKREKVYFVCCVSDTVVLMCFQIREEIKQFGINIYQFPECDSDEDEDFKMQEQILKVG